MNAPFTMLSVYQAIPCNKHPLSNRCPPIDNNFKILGKRKKEQNQSIYSVYFLIYKSLCIVCCSRPSSKLGQTKNDNTLRFERAIWISTSPGHLNRWTGYSAIFTLSWYFQQKHISFVELVAVMRINSSLFEIPPIYYITPLGPLKLNKCSRHLLDH